MDSEDQTDPLNASFDIIARQEQHEAELAEIRGEVDEVKGRLDRASRAAGRVPLGGGGTARGEVKSFVDGYIRHGRENELKSMSGAVPSDGGYAVPREIDAAIQKQLLALSPIRNVAQVVQVGTAGYRKLVSLGSVGAGWVGETDARPDTAASKFAEIAPPFGELYANPAASQAMLDDAMFDVEGWLASEIAREFAQSEGAAFVNGTGTNQPKGFLAAPTSAASDATRAFGTLQFTVTGNATGLDTVAPDSRLIDMVHTLKPGHRQNAVWVMNSTTLAAIRKIKTSTGDFLWDTTLTDGFKQRLLGYPRERQHYLAGFVAVASDAEADWPRIDAAASQSRELGVAETFVWALPQVCRDGFVRLPDPDEDDTMNAFDDIAFPLPLGRQSSVTPSFSTSVTTTASGFERRSSLWNDARLRFDAGTGIRSDADLGTLIAFFRARRGQARGFRLRDATDFSSAGMVGTPGVLDQPLGLGDASTTRFALVKLYGNGPDAQVRRITRPVAGSVVVAVGGVATGAFTIGERGVIELGAAPGVGVAVTAGFRFDVPVRFAEDTLDIAGVDFAAGEAASIPLVEVREED